MWRSVREGIRHDNWERKNHKAQLRFSKLFTGIPEISEIPLSLFDHAER